jgi:23S rRNA (guanosine2251-2'-O)-methyltransferase
MKQRRHPARPHGPNPRGRPKQRFDRTDAAGDRPSSDEVKKSNAKQPPNLTPSRTNESERHEQRIYGVLPILEALRAGTRNVDKIIIAEGVHESRLKELFALAREANVIVRRAPRSELERIAHGANHQGVIASVAAAKYLTSEELVERLALRIGTDDPPLALVLDGVEDPRNLGAIIRTAECAGAHGVFLPERRAAGLTETVAKTAAGALEYIPVARAANVTRLIEDLKSRDVWTVGAAADAKRDYTDWDWTLPCALVVGGEGSGLRRLVRDRCDELVRIPLRGKIASLNVSVAAGIVLFEAVRRRTLARSDAYTKLVKNDAATK